MNSLQRYLLSLSDRELMPTAIKVAMVIGSVLFLINHGYAFMHNEMTRVRWISAAITYVIPYSVNIHGQFSARSRQEKAS